MNRLAFMTHWCCGRGGTPIVKFDNAHAVPPSVNPHKTPRRRNTWKIFDYEALSIQRNATGWIKALNKFGFISPVNA